MKRGGTEDARMERHNLLWLAYPVTEAMVKSQLMLQMRVMSGSTAMQQQRSVSMSVSHITTKDHMDSPSWTVIYN